MGGYRRRFDPERHRIIGLDQRGCGRSTPLAIDALDRLDDNTTPDADRRHRGAARASRGRGVARPRRVVGEHPRAGLRAGASATSVGDRAHRRHHHAAARRWTGSPRAWVASFPRPGRGSPRSARPGERLVETYARLLRHPDPAVRARAANAWDEWESTHVSLDPNWTPGPQSRTTDEPAELRHARHPLLGQRRLPPRTATGSSTGWASSPASRACSSTVGTTSAARRHGMASCTGGGPAAA